MDQRILSALRRAFEQYCPIPDDAWALASPSFVERRIPGGDHLSRAGQRAEHISFVASGIVREYLVTPEETLRNEAFFMPGEITSALADLANDTAPKTSTQALCPTTLVVAPVLAFRRWAEEHLVWRQVVALAAHRRRELARSRERALVTRTAIERYVALSKSRPDLIEHVPPEHIASYIGVSPEALVRIRQGLKGRMR